MVRENELVVSARERLLDAAASLFYADGLAATGINAVIERAGVAKMSLYNNFASKDELVCAYLEARHREWMGLFEVRSADATSPAETVLAVFDAYVDHAEFAYERGFRGCGLLNAAAELPVGAPGRDAVRAHKEQVEQILVSSLGQVTTNDRATEVAEHFSFLLEGAMARAGLEGTSQRLERAKGIAAGVLATL